MSRELRRLEKMRDRGLLGADAFAAEKARLAQAEAAPAARPTLADLRSFGPVAGTDQALRLIAGARIAVALLLANIVYEQVLTAIFVPGGRSLALALGNVAAPVVITILFGWLTFGLKARAGALLLVLWAVFNAIVVTVYGWESRPLLRIPTLLMCWPAALLSLQAVRGVFRL